MLRCARVLMLLVFAAGCSGAKSDKEKARLSDRLSEERDERERLALRVVELERQLEKARLPRSPSRPASEPERPRLGNAERMLTAHLNNKDRMLAKALADLRRARATVKRLEEEITVKDAMLKGSKVDIDKAVRAQIDRLHRRSLSSEKAAEVAQENALALRAQVVDSKKELIRARREIILLRGAEARDNTGVERASEP